MNVLKKHRLANADIEQGARYYEEQKPGLGLDFLDEVERVLRIIGQQPLRYGIRFGKWHRANLRRFP